MGMISYNGVTSDSLGIVVEHYPSYTYAERDYEKVHVPGRSGDIFLDNGSYKNVQRTYEIAAGSYNGPAVTHFANISAWLHSGVGYCKLFDSYEPEYFRMAAYVETGDIANILGHAGRVTVNFDCKPQRYLHSGDSFVAVQSGQVLVNAYQPSLPILDIVGTGDCTVNCNGYVANIDDLEEEIFIDSDLMDCYFGTTNLNSKVELPTGFPVLKPGNNTITFTGSITQVKIKPRWWTI